MKCKKRGPGKPDGMNYMDTLTVGVQAQRAAIDAAAQEKFDRYVRRLQQMCIDAAFMAANDVFHMGSTRCEAFGWAMVDYLNEMAVMMREDAQDDADINYTKGKVDQRLQKICGEKFEPWEVRYDTNL